MTTNKYAGCAPGPWSSTRTVLRDADGNSIASGGNNRVVVGDRLAASLSLAADAPMLLDRAERAEAQRDLLAEALIPFSKLLREHHGLTADDLRAARAALAELEKEQG